MTDTTPAFVTRRTRLPVLLLTNPLPDPFAVLVARRAQRVSNRDRDAAARFERLHLALRDQVKARA